jgi:recombinational DNA repair protein (RecF pathway)
VSLQIACGKNLDLITEASTLADYPRLRDSLNRVRIAYLLAELIEQLTAENQEQVGVYGLLCDTVAQLDSETASNNLIAEFEKQLLVQLGFGLPDKLDRASLERHIFSITERPLNSKKIK